MRLRALEIAIETTGGPYGLVLDFPNGLVVFCADNSMGKSTCVRAILFALGMEATLTSSQSDLPFTPVMKDALNGENDEKHIVMESIVRLRIENRQQDTITIERAVKAAQDKDLVRVRTSDNTVHDFFVNRPGTATREAGFHRFLANFLGWRLPLVHTYEGVERPLYLQYVFPYFMVEQTRGWTSTRPPLPTHYGIRDPHKRVIEFLLDLDAHKVAQERQEIQLERSRIESGWQAQVAAIHASAKLGHAIPNGVPDAPLAAWPPSIAPVLLVSENGSWIDLAMRRARRASELAALLEDDIPRVQEVVLQVQQQLVAAEGTLREKQAVAAKALELLAVERQEVERVRTRVATLDEDIQRSKDAKSLRALGAAARLSISSGACPVCRQAVQDTLLPLPSQYEVMSLDDNLEFLAEQRRTFDGMLTSGLRVVEARERQVAALTEELMGLRGTVRALRQTLVEDGRAPSIAAVRERVELESGIDADDRLLAAFQEQCAAFAPLVEQWRENEKRRAKLPGRDQSESDKKKLARWSDLVRVQLQQYGFKSLPTDEISISPLTYRPEHDGFNLESSVSASDLVRTIWASANGLLELARTEETQHPGLLVFDEPRQQSAREVSFAALLQRVSQAGRNGQQVLFFTSEKRTVLEAGLSKVPHTLVAFEGRMIKPRR